MLWMVTVITLLPGPVGSVLSDSLVGCVGFRTPAMTVVFGRWISASSNPLPSPNPQNQFLEAFEGTRIVMSYLCWHQL